MYLTRETTDNLRLRRVHPTDKLKKPRQAREKPRYFGRILTVLQSNPKHPLKSILALKADGRSGHLTVKRGPTMCDDDGLELHYRTESGARVMCLPFAGRYLQKELRLRDVRLNVEISAVVDGKEELGHFHVEKAVNAFVENGHKNKGRLQLRLRVFGMHSLEINERHHTPKIPPLDFLRRVVIPDNGLLEVVPFREYTMTAHRGDILFRDGPGKVVAESHEAFCAMALAEAHKSGAEGWVFYVSDDVFEHEETQYASNDPTVEDGFGTHRSRSALKIKPEFTGQYVALKVCHTKDDGDVTMTRLYRRQAGRLVYAADVTDHPVIESYMRMKAAGYMVSTCAEERALFSLDPEEVREARAAMQFEVTAANISPNGYLMGVKIWGTSKPLPFDFGAVTVTLDLAKENGHFRSTGRAREALKAILEDEEDRFKPIRWKASAPLPTLKRALEPEPEPPVKVAKPAPVVAPVFTYQDTMGEARRELLEFRKNRPPPTPHHSVKKRVYIHESIRLDEEEMRKLRESIESNGHTLVTEGDNSEHLIAVFSAMQLKRLPGPCTCRFFQEEFPNATISCLELLDDRLRF